MQSVGRFNRVDPLASSANSDTPQTWNRYAYATNDSINKVDPTGLEPPSDPLRHPFRCATCGPPPAPWELDPCSPVGASYTMDGFQFNAGIFCGGPIPAPPGPEPLPTCQIGLNVNPGSRASGTYFTIPRKPLFNPSTQQIGPDIDALNDLWFYFFEVIFSSDDPRGFILRQSAVVRGSYTVDFGRGTKVTYDYNKDIPNDSPHPENVDYNRPNGFSWFDAPLLSRITDTGDRVSDADITWTLNFTVTNFRTTCAASLTLHLVVTNGQPAWTHTP